MFKKFIEASEIDTVDAEKRPQLLPRPTTLPTDGVVRLLKARDEAYSKLFQANEKLQQEHVASLEKLTLLETQNAKLHQEHAASLGKLTVLEAQNVKLRIRMAKLEKSLFRKIGAPFRAIHRMAKGKKKP